ncbi:hypothetical protein [Bradyrhizobium sp. WSM3983]|uniref:hypothetical protein n=1 Tax=Bradyrhizobium sp. WSM3983 TaxID=1038867 RepID=UPI000564A81C|nr:hypothetical protein [Bradyrhizobium sp. WSM3983]
MGPGHTPGRKFVTRPMLPGFRFLLAAILLSASILVFGLGAASLLRASHEQYVSNPSWRNGPQERMFAQASEPAQPVLAALRVAPAANEAAPVVPEQVPSIGLPAVETGPEQMAAVTLEAQPQAQPEPRVVAVAPPAETAPPATEGPAPEPAKGEAAAPAPADTLTPADTAASTATTTPAPIVSATEVPRTATPALASRVSDIAAARMAALNELAPAKTKADSATAKPRAHKPKKRHRIVRRPPPQQLQQALDPFGRQQQQTLATTATRTRQ